MRSPLRSMASCWLLSVTGMAAAGMAVPGLAEAQTRWAVIAASDSDATLPEAIRLGEHALAALDAQGEAALRGDAAVGRVERELSRPFEPAPVGLAERVQQSEESILEDVALGRVSAAIDAGDAVLESVEDHIAALARDPAVATSIGNVCLFLVRAELQSRQAERAQARAGRCLRLVPGLTADENLHPPNVVAVLQRARRDLDGGLSGGVLSIQGAATDPAGCSIRVNGSIVGATPWIRIALPVGAYGVQVECSPETPARLSTVEVAAEGSTRLTSSGRLSEALDTSSSGIALRYHSGVDLYDALSEDLGLLGSALSVDRILVGVVVAGEATLAAFEIDAAEGRARLSGRAAVEEPRDSSASAAVERARTGAGVEGARTSGSDTTGLDGTSLVTDRAEARSSGGSGDVAVAVLGGSFVVVGAAGLGISWYLWTETEARGRALNETTSVDLLFPRQRDFDNSITPLVIAGAAGGLFASIGTSLLTTQSQELVPWWSWVIGGAGLALAGVGVGLMFVNGECYGNASIDTDCVRRAPMPTLGVLVLEHAAPLLAVPITSWIRAAIGPGADAATVSLHLLPDDLSVSVSLTL